MIWAILDGTLRGLLGGRDHKVADAAALQFGGLFHQVKHIGGDAGRSGVFGNHGGFPLRFEIGTALHCTFGCVIVNCHVLKKPQ